MTWGCWGKSHDPIDTESAAIYDDGRGLYQTDDDLTESLRFVFEDKMDCDWVEVYTRAERRKSEMAQIMGHFCLRVEEDAEPELGADANTKAKVRHATQHEKAIEILDQSLRDFHDSEAWYVGALDALCGVCLNKLRMAPSWLEGKGGHRVLANVAMEIQQLHCDMTLEMQPVLSLGGWAELSSELRKNFLHSISILMEKVHSSYIRYVNQIPAMGSYSSRNPDAKAALAECRADPRLRGLSFQELLLAPLQRTVGYLAFLERLYKAYHRCRKAISNTEQKEDTILELVALQGTVRPQPCLALLVMALDSLQDVVNSPIPSN